MADIETFTEEQAEELFKKSYPGTAPEVEPAAPAEPEAVTAEPETAPAEPVAEPTPATEPAAPATPAVDKTATPDPYDWVEKIPEDLRNKVVEQIEARMQIEHAKKSDDGRIAAHQRKVLELERKLAEFKKPASAPATAERQPPTTPEGWQQLAKSDPELAQAIEARVKSEIESAVHAVKDELQEFSKAQIAPIYKQDEQRYVESQRNELKTLVPNYEQVVQTPQYTYWLANHASEGVRDLALKSVNAQDAVTVLQKYADDMVRLGYYKPPVAAPVETPTPASTTEADKVAAARAAKVGSTTVIPSAPIAPTAGAGKGPVGEADAQKLFEQEWKKLLAKKT